MKTTTEATQATPTQDAISSLVAEIVENIQVFEVKKELKRVLHQAEIWFNHPQLDTNAISWNRENLTTAGELIEILDSLSDPDRKEVGTLLLIEQAENMADEALLNLFDIALFGRLHLNKVVEQSEPASAVLVHSLFFVRELAKWLKTLRNVACKQQNYL